MISQRALRLMTSAICLAILLVLGLSTAARAESIEAAHARLLAGNGQVNFDPLQPENTRTIEAAWIVEAANKHVDINIYGAVIRGPLVMPYFTFEGEVQLGRCTFDGFVNFAFTTFNRQLKVYQSVFRSGASFEEATFNSGAFFWGSEFDGGGVGFHDAHARGVFDASDAIFGGKAGMIASFPRAQFDRGARFDFARFDTDVDFSAAKFGEKTDFLGTQFRGIAIFDRAHFAQVTSFGDLINKKLISTFWTRARFNLTQFDSDVLFLGVPFHGDAEFVGTRFGGDAFFEGATFHGDARFDRSQIVGSAVFHSESTLPPATFVKGAWFDYAHFESDVFFDGARFEGPVNFQEAACHLVHFSQLRQGAGKAQEAEFDSTLDLRGFTYDRMYASWRNLLSKYQTYDRRPFTQLEKVLRSTGEDDEADQVYLARCKAERQEVKWKQNKLSWLIDCVWWVTANYGILSFQLFLMPAFFVIWGVILYGRPGAIQRNPYDRFADNRKGPFTLWDAVQLSVRSFLPFEVPWDDYWKPAHRGYAFWLKILGWLFVPLWIAVLAGVFRHLPS
jgi:Pentapeptide repeats (9 copies)